ncbi:MAG: phenylalanine--tRNA ligase subunit beta [Patescibacteria group bacterium]
MKVSLDWLNEYVKIRLPADQLAEKFTVTGSEVERVENIPRLDDRIIVGEIKTIIKHPHADRLQVAKVDIGKDRLFDIVCGAPNIKPEQKVAVAQVDTILPNGMKIESAVIRGYKSLGMICAEDELGLGTDHEGILVLDKDLAVGQTLNKVLGTGDAVLHFAITPNRADCFSVIGLAREAAAFTKSKLHLPAVRLIESGPAINTKMKVTIRDRQLCPRYTARYLTDVKIGPSPLWLKSRLRKAGIKSINNVVDITNYVMLETGQPLHAFDADLVANRSIIVRRAKQGEKLMTLDEEEKELTPDMLVIADPKKVIAAAGVMGGQESGIGSATKSIILESAIFDPVAVRNASQKLNLRTESSSRFEKGLDPAMTTLAIDRAAELIRQIANGAIANGRIDTQKQQNKLTDIKLPIEKIYRILNIRLSNKLITDNLARLGFAVRITGKKLLLIVPSWRPDIRIAEDVIEEVGRLYDYNNLKPTKMTGQIRPVRLSSMRQLERKVKDWLVGAGLTEVMNYTYYGEQEKAVFGQKTKHIEIDNPLSHEQKYLRTSLLPGLLSTIRTAKDGSAVFETGNIFRYRKNKVMPEEKRKLAMAFSMVKQKENMPPETRLQYRWLKSWVDRIFSSIKLSAPVYKMTSQAGWLVAVEIYSDKKNVGNLYITVNAKKNKQLYGLIEIELESLLAPTANKIEELSKYPSVDRDVAFWLDRSIAWDRINRTLADIDELITDIKLFDIYADEQRPKKRSLAVRITMQSHKQTLEADKVEAVMGKINDVLKKQFQAEIRD